MKEIGRIRLPGESKLKTPQARVFREEKVDRHTSFRVRLEIDGHAEAKSFSNWTRHNLY